MPIVPGELDRGVVRLRAGVDESPPLEAEAPLQLFGDDDLRALAEEDRISPPALSGHIDRLERGDQASDA